MTCIVAVKHEGKLYFGADSYLSDSGFAYPMKDHKFFRKGPFLIGYCNSVRAGKVFQYEAEFPDPDYSNLPRYMNTEFTAVLTDLAQRHNFELDETLELNDVADLIVGIDGRLFEVQSHVQAIEWPTDYMAIGSGARPALGSLHSTKHLPPTQRTKLALEAAAMYSEGVGKPFHYATM